MNHPLLQVRDLSAGYRDHSVLDGVGFDIRAGELVSLFGPNGTGKSTLFRCLLGRMPHTGTALLDGKEIRRLPDRHRAQLVTHVPQEHGAVFPVSVVDIVLLGRTPYLHRHRGPRPADLTMALQALERVQAVHLADRIFTRLSGGQRQLVLIARALAQNCPLLLLDEPTASLDYGNQLMVWQVVQEIADRGRAVLICTHDPGPVRQRCHRALVLGRSGRLLADGPPHEAVSEDILARLYPTRHAASP